MTEEERRRLLGGILGINRARRRMGPGLSQSFGRDIEALKHGVATSKQHPLTIEINKMGEPLTPVASLRGIPSARIASGGPRKVTGLGTGKTSYGPDGRLITVGQAYRPASSTGQPLSGPFSNNAMKVAGTGATQTPKKEEDEYGFLDAIFLANLVAGMQGGPPPTPYGTAVGGGNKTWASLPSLMRMS